MARGHDPADRREQVDEGREREAGEEPDSRPRPELRWVQIREPRHAVEIGRNGRIVATRFRRGYDRWEVLLETYEGELSD